jgi:hypothetical protein
MAEHLADDSYLTAKAEFARRIAIPMIGVAMIISNGYGLFVDLPIRDSLASNTELTCVSDVTPRLVKGRYTTCYFSDALGNHIRSCSQFEGSYRGLAADEGKLAKICYSDKALASVEVEGVSRLAREDRLDEMINRIWLRKLMVAIGLLCLGLSAFVERNAFMRPLSSRSSQ